MVSRFSCCPVFAEEVKKITRDIKTNKVVGGEIQTTILKDCEFTFHILTKCVNKFIENRFFPDNLKLINVKCSNGWRRKKVTGQETSD